MYDEMFSFGDSAGESPGCHSVLESFRCALQISRSVQEASR